MATSVRAVATVLFPWVPWRRDAARSGTLLVESDAKRYFGQVTSGPSPTAFIDGLAAGGRYTFTTDDAVAALGVSPVAARAALRRLAAKGYIAQPFRGFQVIVPPEYRRLGSLPPEQFIPQLMLRLRERYYVALLSAAQYHGAAHHRPQRFQVAVAKNRSEIVCGSVEVEFVARKEIARVPTVPFNTPRGPIRVSSVEATALDLIGYPTHTGVSTTPPPCSPSSARSSTRSCSRRSRRARPSRGHSASGTCSTSRVTKTRRRLWPPSFERTRATSSRSFLRSRYVRRRARPGGSST